MTTSASFSCCKRCTSSVTQRQSKALEEMQATAQPVAYGFSRDKLVSRIFPPLPILFNADLFSLEVSLVGVPLASSISRTRNVHDVRVVS